MPFDIFGLKIPGPDEVVHDVVHGAQQVANVGTKAVSDVANGVASVGGGAIAAAMGGAAGLANEAGRHLAYGAGQVHQAVSNLGALLGPQEPPAPPRKTVFVVHGRNHRAWIAMREFLEALGLQARNFQTILQNELFDTASPSTHDIVKAGVMRANGVLVLCTPDEHVELHTTHRSADDHRTHDYERWQPRPNVLYEAGMAFALNPKRTFFVTMGANVQLFSDVDGFYPVRMIQDNDEIRKEIIGRLRSAEVEAERDKAGSWKSAGDFKGVLESLPPRTDPS